MFCCFLTTHWSSPVDDSQPTDDDRCINVFEQKHFLSFSYTPLRFMLNVDVFVDIYPDISQRFLSFLSKFQQSQWRLSQFHVSSRTFDLSNEISTILNTHTRVTPVTHRVMEQKPVNLILLCCCRVRVKRERYNNEVLAVIESWVEWNKKKKNVHVCNIRTENTIWIFRRFIITSLSSQQPTYCDSHLKNAIHFISTQLEYNRPLYDLTR